MITAAVCTDVVPLLLQRPPTWLPRGAQHDDASSGGTWSDTQRNFRHVWAVDAYIDRRAAHAFERERRATLLIVPHALPPGAVVLDRRADRSVLELRILLQPKLGMKRARRVRIP